MQQCSQSLPCPAQCKAPSLAPAAPPRHPGSAAASPAPCAQAAGSMNGCKLCLRSAAGAVHVARRCAGWGGGREAARRGCARLRATQGTSRGGRARCARHSEGRPQPGSHRQLQAGWREQQGACLVAVERLVHGCVCGVAQACRSANERDTTNRLRTPSCGVRWSARPGQRLPWAAGAGRRGAASPPLGGPSTPLSGPQHPRLSNPLAALHCPTAPHTSRPTHPSATRPGWLPL